MDFSFNEEHRMLRDAVREFAEKEIMPYGREYDEKAEYPWEIFRRAAKLGFVGADIPEEYGGAGMDFISIPIICMELTRADSGIGSAIAASTLGCPMVKYFGTEEQKERYLRAVAEGKTTSAIAITEPDAGSDVNSIKTRAEKVEGGYILNGSKTFITNGGISDWVVVIARTDLNAKPAYKGFSALVVEKSMEGFETKPIKKMGLNCHDTSELYFRNVFIPQENLVGTENFGFYQLMRFFNESRILVGAIQLGIAIGAYERALQYAKERKAFGKPLIEHQAIQFKLADMFTAIESAKLLIFKAAYLVDKGEPNPALSSAAKLYASETAIKVTYEAVQVFGGYGFSKEYDVERYYRDARVGTIYEGTSEIQRLIIGRFLAGKLGF
ncbi:butyryl-CoA dehydrogenase [Archaeoglobus sulfaticallidus PM70-1]|uniref:Butyryl-CoA dehydrogenase n=1 Tax=Archaeoglobus sulfaticallidus PM70-1 TaxID=387631 RepID=N0BAN8_9EURY|nr:acyl-CoA dehydrogenase family protein [Archaeoglobus sulfaticallidus]AGK60053.1 butyryl-CoA dehydrogenase [Archaeoglobus sulfaticallidus PM70-1]